jgi:hypothetical protein
MNTNEHEYYFRADKAAIFSLLFVNIRVHSWLKFFPGLGNGHKPQNPLAPAILRPSTSDKRMRSG